MCFKLLPRLFIFLISLLLCSNTALCEVDKNSASLPRSWNGFMLSPHGSYRSLFIYVNIIYDASVADSVASNEIWPQSQTEGINVDTASWPTYLTDFIDVEYDPENIHGMFTKLFAESSFNKLILTGDFMIVNIKHSSVSLGGEFKSIPLLDSVMQMINLNGGLNTLNGYNSIQDYASSDPTKFDLVHFIIRNARSGYGDYWPGNGSAGAGDWIRLKTSDGETYSALQSSVQCVGNIDISLNPTSIIIHEFSHLIFGPNSFHTSGGHSWGGKMCFPAIQYGYGLMGAASSGLVNCNGFDRFRVGWMSDENTTSWPITALGVISDISRENGNQSFMLRDFITSGDVVRIKLPFIQAPASNQYIWLENHKMLDSTLNFLQYSNTNPECRPQAKKGIYAYYQVGKDTIDGSTGIVYPGHDTDNLKMICANGFYDQVYKGTIPGSCVGTGAFDYFADQSPNPLSGNNDLSAYFLDIPGDDTLKPGIHAKNAMAKTYFHSPNDTVKHLPYLMSDINAFQGFNEMSLNTNPAPFNTATYYHSPYVENNTRLTETVETFRNLPEVYISGLKIAMTPIDEDDYLVDISWDNYDLHTEVRWTGQIVLHEMLYVKPGATLLLDQSGTAGSIYRHPVSGMFSAPTQLRCAGGSLMVQHDESTVKLDNNSTLLLESGSHFLSEGGLLSITNGSFLRVASGGVFEQRQNAMTNIENSGTLLIEQGGHYIIDGGNTTIKPGGRLEIESCATIEIRNGGMLAIQGFAEICLHPGAFFIIDSMQNLQFSFGFSTGNCMEFTPANFEHTVIAAPPTFLIQGNVEWNNVTYNYTEDLRIDSAAVFNLSGGSELRFAAGKKLIVERGASLSIADSKLTNLCANQAWSGIEVWGDAKKSQLEPGAQGLLYISDRALIENAIIGVLAGKTFSETFETDATDIDPAFGGGIVVANMAFFNNNQTGIFLAPYENLNHENGLILNNASRIENCGFNCTSMLFSQMDFIKLIGVRGLEINGNIFSQPPTLNASTTGILSLNSSFRVGEYGADRSTISKQTQASRFENLRYGIKALGTGSEKTFAVENALFVNNTLGIFSSANYNFSIVGSDFKIQNLSSSKPRKSGLYVDGPVYGFQITENQFTGNYSGTSFGSGSATGIAFNNTGSHSNVLYNNQFDSLYIAIHAMNQNRGRDNYSGLCISCNDFGLNRHAILVIHDSTSTGPSGIAHYQGGIGNSTNALGGNTFLNSDLWESHFYVHGKPMVYFYPNTTSTEALVKPTQLTPNAVFLLPNNKPYFKPASCTSTMNKWFEPDYHELRINYETRLVLLQEKLDKYQRLIDGGDTELLLQKINLSHPGDAIELRRLLLNFSPWLSDTVLISAIGLRHVLPDFMIREIIKANSHASKSPQLNAALISRFGKLKDDFAEIVILGKQSLSAREALEAEILNTKAGLQQTLMQLMLHLMNDSYDPGTDDELLTLLLEQALPEYWYIAAMMLMEQGNIFDASGTLNAMPARFAFNTSEAAAHGNVKSMIEKMYFLSLQRKNLLVPDSVTIQWLFGIRNTGLEPAATYARNILISADALTYEPHLIYPKQSEAPPSKPPDIVEYPPRISIMNVFPNPALDYILVDYDLSILNPSQNDDQQIIITSAEGRNLSSIKLGKLQNQLLVSLKDYPAGIYIMSLYDGGTRIESKRIVVY
ncbi:MAG: T9SS type A sorting domain-containing protein [Bacteroidales bacterium]|nr:T9SS type A sorting domain-containing protein [Bacteroidales bacterium]